MRVSVAVCTRNRADPLDRCLASMRALRIPSGVEWELVVVDNGSTDGTSEVLSRHRGQLPLRLVRERRGGLSHARNRAVSAARGEYILWTDDDAEVDSEWLAAYCAAFARWPGGVLFGGPITPRLEGTPPGWLRWTLPRFGTYFAARDFGPHPLPLALPKRLPFGCNYAVLTREQRRFRYDPALGRQPDHLGLSGEETQVMEAMLVSGGRGWWVPEAGVWHVIPPERQTLAHLREHSRGDAIYRIRQVLDEGERPGVSLLGSLFWAVTLETAYRISRLWGCLQPES